MPAPLIRAAKITWIWSDTVIDNLEKPPTKASLLCPRNQLEYALAFNDGGGETPPLEHPWPSFGRHNFWHYYLESKDPARIEGAQAWKLLVPFRVRIPIIIRAPVFQPRILAEGFYYPHGVELMLTLTCEGMNYGLDEFVHLVLGLRSGKFIVDWKTDSTSFPLSPWAQKTSLNLNQISSDVLAMLRQVGFGRDAESAFRYPEPFSIVTVLKGTVDDPAAPVVDGDVIHRALQALSGWSHTWGIDRLPPLSQATLALKGAAPSHVCYFMSRGRAVWFPGLFSNPNFEGRTLSCYHRNQSFASLQVESLIGLAIATAAILNAQQPLAFNLRECARAAAGILGRLWGGDTTTYRSQTAKVHMQSRIQQINIVRKFFNMQPLI